ncbi:MAG: Na/Pi cotransporter family protein, partial [Gammaproteobacteria bacterium]|nr:Na/Pi cotransporter family protein [Gammaproteobacteria bacterium]
MVMGLLGGLALFLFGMEQMSDGLKAAAGNSMKTLLGRLTRNRVTAALTGATVTALIQSSSVTTVLVVGFVSAGLMTLPQSIGVIMGANVGTTVTAQIVAFKVEEAALLIIAVGFAMLFLSNNDRVKQYGNIIMGLGMVFFGMSTMSEAMEPLRTYQPFIDLMAKMENPLLGILAAAVFTAMVQSSSATTGIVIAMASQGLITLAAGIALIFGSNIGTCVTALLAAFGKSTEAVRVACVHVLFNVAGVLLWVMFIPQLAGIVAAVSPASPE